MKVAKYRAVFGLSSAGAVAVSMFWYRSVFLSTYGVLDDYRLVEQAQRGIRIFRMTEGHASTELATGRLVPSFLFTIIWRFVDDVSDLKFIRLFGFAVVVSALVMLAYFASREFELDRMMSAASSATLVFLGILLPGSVATVTWAQKATQLLAIPMAVGAGVLAARSRQMSRRTWLTVVILLSLSVFSYQQFVMMSTLPVAIAGANQFIRSRSRELLKRTIWVTLASLLALVINYMLVYLFDSSVIGEDSIPIADRVKNLVVQTLPFAIHLRVAKDFHLVAVTAALGATAVVLLIRARRSQLLLIAAVAYSTFLSALVSLGSNREINYRMAMPIQMTAWLGIAILIFSCAHQWTRSRNALRTALLFSALLITLFVAGDALTSVNQRIVNANSDEWAEVIDNVQSAKGLNAKQIILQMQDTPLSGPCAVYSEIGLLGRHVRWVLEDQYRLAVYELSLAQPNWNPEVVVISEEDFPPESPPAFEADLSVGRNC